MQKKLLNNYSVADVTHVGCVRQHNEDNTLIDFDLDLFLVADGMGGHYAGEVASEECLAVIKKVLALQEGAKEKLLSFSQYFFKRRQQDSLIKKRKKNIESAITEANQHVFQLNVERNFSSGTGMGTTIAGVWIIRPELMLVFHVGDSRIYRFRKQKLEPLSKDHSVLQQWYDKGCMGERPAGNVIVNAIGPYEKTSADVQAIELESEDVFLICSDGLTDMVDDVAIADNLQGVCAEQVDKYSQKLLALALEQGGKDNISIILIAHK